MHTEPLGLPTIVIPGVTEPLIDIIRLSEIAVEDVAQETLLVNPQVTTSPLLSELLL